MLFLQGDFQFALLSQGRCTLRACLIDVERLLVKTVRIHVVLKGKRCQASNTDSILPHVPQAREQYLPWYLPSLIWFPETDVVSLPEPPQPVRAHNLGHVSWETSGHSCFDARESQPNRFSLQILQRQAPFDSSTNLTKPAEQLFTQDRGFHFVYTLFANDPATASFDGSICTWPHGEAGRRTFRFPRFFTTRSKCNLLHLSALMPFDVRNFAMAPGWARFPLCVCCNVTYREASLQVLR